MEEALYAILVNTYNPDSAARSQAESTLASCLSTPGALLSLLRLASRASFPREIRQAAAITAKNNIRRLWKSEGPVATLSHEEKEAIKLLILEIAIPETDNSMRSLFAEISQNIADFDYPDSWPTLVPFLLENAQSPEIIKMYNSLYVLRKLVKRYEL